MAAQRPPKQLTPEDFGKFLRWLSPDDSRSVGEYERVRSKITEYFVHKGCSDPNELFDRVVDIVARKIETCVEYPNPLAYCYGVARNVWREDLRHRKPIPLNEDLPAQKEPEENPRGRALECLERCMNRLQPGDRELVTQYYQGEGNSKIEARKKLAADTGGSNASRIRMCRIRKKLRVCITTCLQHSAN